MLDDCRERLSFSEACPAEDEVRSNVRASRVDELNPEINPASADFGRLSAYQNNQGRIT